MTTSPVLSPATTQTRGWSRLDGVDFLRTLAILFVLLNHVNMRLVIARIPYTQGMPVQLIRSLVWNGQYGVQIFFAISGFLITATSLRRWTSLSGISIGSFYGLRFARIAPLLLLLLAILSALDLAGVRNFVIPERTGGLPRALLAAVTFHLNVLEAQRGYLPGNWDILWSLSVEEMFYLCFPLACRLFGRGKLLIALLLLFVAMGPLGRTVLAHNNEIWQQESYLGGMDAIALGCLTAIMLSKQRLPRAVFRLSGVVGAALLLLVLGYSAYLEPSVIGRTGLDMTLLAIGTCMIIAAAAESAWRSPSLLRPILLLGQRSYEVYLSHMFVVFAFFSLFMNAGKPVHAIPILFLGTILVAGVLGEFVARFYSEPMNRIIRKRLKEGPPQLGAIAEVQSAVEESTLNALRRALLRARP